VKGCVTERLNDTIDNATRKASRFEWIRIEKAPPPIGVGLTRIPNSGVSNVAAASSIERNELESPNAEGQVGRPWRSDELRGRLVTRKSLRQPLHMGLSLRDAERDSMRHGAALRSRTIHSTCSRR
jgi:hypothetical protein